MTSKPISLQPTPVWRSLALRAVWPLLLGFLTLIGVAAGLGRLFLGLGASTALTDSYPWGIWIGFDFGLIAFSGAGFTMAALVHLFHLRRYRAALRPAILAGLLGYGSVLLLLVLDLGRPDRFYHFILFWNVHSPLFEISWCVLLYSSVLAVETLPCLFEQLKQDRWLRLTAKIMTPITIIGVTLSTLHQSTLGTLYLNMPHRLHSLWYTAWLPGLFFVSSILAGLGLAVLAYRLATRIQGQPEDERLSAGLIQGVAAVAGLYLLLKLGDLLLAGELPALLALDSMSLFLLAELGLGLLLPLLIWAHPGLHRLLRGDWSIPLLVLGGVLLNRFNATMFGQLLPPGTTYNPHILEWLSTAGILAGAALVWYLGVRFLAICPSSEE